MPFGSDDSTSIPALPIIFHNIPYANPGSEVESARFGYPIAAVKEIARQCGLDVSAEPASFHD